MHRAKVSDVRGSRQLVDAYAGPILLEKTLANLFEDVTEFWVAEFDGVVVGCGALHVLWEDLGEIRTVATDPAARGHGVGRAVCDRDHRRRPGDLGLHRLFVLTFEVRFFRSWGSSRSANSTCPGRRTPSCGRPTTAGVAEFLDLPYVKPNTLGNTRMLKIL